MPSRIFALRGCPGGGLRKTTTLARYSNAYCDTYGPHNVAIASLTRTAAHEIAGRDTRVPDHNIATLHGHTYRAVECTREEMAETGPRMREFAAEHPEYATENPNVSDPLDDAATEGSGIHSAVMNQRARLAPLDMWTQDERDYHAAWSAWKQRHGLLDFTDLIEKAADNPSILPHADALLLDESQDFSALELRLALNWSHETQTTILCADPDQCQPGDTLVETTVGAMPMQSLIPAEHRLLSFDRHGSRINGKRSGGYEFSRSIRPYEGPMLTVAVDGVSSRCTPDHRWPIKWTGERTACCVYLMRKCDRWRIGWCQIHRNGSGGFHLGVRARLEKADAAWILSVHSEREAASVAESITSTQFGLPTIMFEPRPRSNGHCTGAAIEAVYAALDPEEQRTRAHLCLYEHGRDVRWPIWSAAEQYAKQRRRTSWVVRACNLIPGHMSIAKARGSYGDWLPIDSVTSRYETTVVYSLGVKPHETYIADGLVTHNCIYGWRGADPIALQDLPVQGERLLKQSYRCPAAVRDLALDWIKPIAGRRDVTWDPTDEAGTVADTPYAIIDTRELIDHIAALDGTVMVLTSCAYMLEPLLAELRAAGVPFANRHRMKEARWNPLPKWDKDRGAHGEWVGGSAAARALIAYLATDRALHGDQTRARTWGDLHAWTSVVQARGYLARGAKAAIEEHCRRDQFGETRAGDVVPLGTLIELLGDNGRPALRNDIDWFREALMAKHSRAGAYAARVYETRPAALVEEPGLTVGTVHSVKGAESAHVLISPDLSKEGYLGEHGWHGTGQDAIRRLYYVGITRASRSVHIMEPSVPECAPLDVRTVLRRAA